LSFFKKLTSFFDPFTNLGRYHLFSVLTLLSFYVMIKTAIYRIPQGFQTSSITFVVSIVLADRFLKQVKKGVKN